MRLDDKHCLLSSKSLNLADKCTILGFENLQSFYRYILILTSKTAETLCNYSVSAAFFIC